ncbi:restriction endonuclease [Alicyclobacillus ferrooxydans]|uniref:restriction endonuclease n=1 Tax=Alicyclobacillus ferrooxydans TaxID=471514 RepID=UPI0006D55E04|nr:restriction endonuclease [Alicyclobacillus ferrooxydans]
MKLSEMVKDWGGFERLVADLHNTGDVKVEHNVILTGRSGAPRQIDVLITHTQGFYTEKIIVECKYWNTRIKRLHVDAMVAQLQDLNASKAVFFTVKGCQSGAKTMAADHGIEIFLVREPTDDEWGEPGPVLNIHLQVIDRSILKYSFPGMQVYTTAVASGHQGVRLNMTMGSPEVRSATPTIKDDGSPGKTLEQIIDEGTLGVLKGSFNQNAVTFNGGEECTVYMVNPAVISIHPPAHIVVEDKHVLIPQIQIEIGIRVHQSRIVIDRRSSYLYALVVQDVIKTGRFYASRRRNADTSLIAPAVDEAPHEGDEVVKNGSVLHVFTNQWFDPAEMSGLTLVDMETLRNDNVQSNDE